MKCIKIGSRDSKLAVIQARSVIDAVQEQLPQATVELITMKTTGDKILDRTLDKIGGKGLFVKELDRALTERQVDLTVHSLKDMPMELPQGLPIVAVSPRADVRDVLVLPKGVSALCKDKPIGCSSARRRIQLKRVFPEQKVAPVRGNIQTRLRKLDEGEFGALVLAAAGLQRLGLEERISRYFAISEILPAAGQAIIAVQGRENEDMAFLAGYHSEESMVCMRAERAFVRALDGGCSSPIAAYAEMQNGYVHLQGMYVGEDEAEMHFGESTALPAECEEAARTLAKRLQVGGR